MSRAPSTALGRDARAQAFEPAGFFVLRAPLLPTDALLAWSAARDRAELRAVLRAQFDRPEVREALRVASPSLDARYADWLRDPDGESGRKVEHALVRYFARMASRPTPFGLFAGCAVGAVGERTAVALAAPREHRRHTRLDNDYLDALCAALTAQPAVRAGLRFAPNTSLYRLGQGGGPLRYAESTRTGRGRAYSLVGVEANEYVDVALEAARRARAEGRGGATPREIAAALCASDPDADAADAAEFVQSLIDSQVFVPALEPALTGAEPIHGIIAALERAADDGAGEPARDVARALGEARDALGALDAPGELRPLEGPHERLRSALGTLPAAVDPARLLQVDMHLAVTDAVLDRRVVPELVHAAQLVMECVPTHESDALQKFCEEFERRYERREVPLLEALDEDCGIGFDKLRRHGSDPEPLLEGLGLSAVAPSPGYTVGRAWGAFEEMLMRKLEARAPGEREIALEPDALAALKRRDDPLPDAFSLIVSFAAPSPEAAAAGDYRVLLHTIDGPSGANWLGRFCHGDATLAEHVRALLRAEEAHRPDAVFAEVVHLPEGRTGNVLLRPVLREHEITFLGRGGAQAAQQFTPDELTVSVLNGRVVLRAPRLGREIVPRLASAHAYAQSTNLGVYKFLGALQTQGRPIRRAWSWGALDPHATFLPRVTLGRVVLALARWSLKRDHLAPLAAARDAAARVAAARALREALGLPRLVAVADADNALPVDFDNELSVESFAQLVKDRGGALITELFPGPEEHWVRSPEGRHAHEMVVPVVRRAPAPRAAQPAPRPARVRAEPDVPRLFVPGSEWLYAKLYASPRSCDLALLRFAPVLRALRASGAVTGWFFLREWDPHWHLRLRLHGPPARLWGEALPALRALVDALLDERLASRLQLETYQREVEAWGGPRAIALAERFFCEDSEAALAVLERYHAAGGAALGAARWQLALRGTDALWEELGLDLAARRAVARAVRDGLGREFGLHGAREKQLGERHRAMRAELERLCAATPGSGHALGDGLAILARRRAALAPVFAELRALERDGELTRPVREMADRFTHLHVNRMLRSRLREQEMVLADFLERHYRSVLARARPGDALARAAGG